MKIQKFLKSIYYKYFSQIQFHTVVLRGKLNNEQESYLNNHKNYIDNKIMLKEIKTKAFPKVLEIGSGSGSHINYLASLFKEKNISLYGIELDKLSILKTLYISSNKNLYNFKITSYDARLFVRKIEDNIFDGIFILFSDPWKRKRDYKKRLINENFLSEIFRITKTGGNIILSTDVLSYSDEMEKNLHIFQKKNIIKYKKISENDSYIKNSNSLVLGSFKNTLLENYDIKNIFETKFAKRAKREGRINNIFIIEKI